MVARWFQDSVTWVILQLERGSGQVQNVFSKLFPAAQFVFVVAYGVTQPLLPPALLEPTTATWHIIGILRSVGWYAVLPLLLYAPIALWRGRASFRQPSVDVAGSIQLVVDSRSARCAPAATSGTIHAIG